jgi:hypothetical protein
MMHANGTIDHSPPASWNCYTQSGAGTAGGSNLATAPTVGAVDLYMVDPGNPTTIGHRRWILGSWNSSIGVGSTSSYSCMVVGGQFGAPGPDWVAWPPPGVMPLQAMSPSWTTVDDTGWTIQSDSISFSNATVTVTHDGNVMPLDTAVLLPNYGSSSALRFTPDNWFSEEGTYTVEITGTSTPISYDVEMVDCSQYP